MGRMDAQGDAGRVNGACHTGSAPLIWGLQTVVSRQVTEHRQGLREGRLAPSQEGEEGARALCLAWLGKHSLPC